MTNGLPITAPVSRKDEVECHLVSVQTFRIPDKPLQTLTEPVTTAVHSFLAQPSLAQGHVGICERVLGCMHSQVEDRRPELDQVSKSAKRRVADVSECDSAVQCARM